MKKKLLIFSSILFIIDFIIKRTIIENLVFQKVYTIIPHFFYITYVKNTGGAWSILAGNVSFLIGIGICFLGILIYYIMKKNQLTKLEIIYYSLLVGGVCGNFIDRILYGGVVDYLGFIFGRYYFPVFNFADICIVLGVGLFILDGVRK